MKYHPAHNCSEWKSSKLSGLFIFSTFKKVKNIYARGDFCLQFRPVLQRKYGDRVHRTGKFGLSSVLATNDNALKVHLRPFCFELKGIEFGASLATKISIEEMIARKATN